MNVKITVNKRYQYQFGGTALSVVNEAQCIAATGSNVEVNDEDDGLLVSIAKTESNEMSCQFHDEEFHAVYLRQATIPEPFHPVQYPFRTTVNAWFWTEFTPPVRVLKGEITEREPGEPVAIVNTEELPRQLFAHRDGRVLVKSAFGYTWLNTSEIER